MKNTIYSHFKSIAQKYAERAAIIEDSRSITFGELDRLADCIMAKFYDENHKAIGIVMSHGIEQIAAMLAVLKSGAAYVPVEPALPLERRAYMLQRAKVTLIIDDEYCRSLPENPPVMDDRSTPDGVAYILFTSGTTGRPKGVVVENHSVTNYARAFEKEMLVGPGDIMLQYSVCSFDIFVEEVFASLLGGVTLAIPGDEIRRKNDIATTMDFCKRHNVTILDGFPYLVADLNHRPELLPDSVKLIVSGGDVVRENYISNLRNKGVRIYNTYGPSETTVCSNYFRIDNADPLEDGSFPIGRPVEGVDVTIRDADGCEVGTGVVGEICITGEGVSRGYLDNPPESANFVTLQDGRRMYRSGDMGYRLPDGNFVFIGRRDKQVMILGQRVEPEEVENVLNEYPHIEKGVVRAFLDEKGLHYLVAYVQLSDNFSIASLKEFMHSKLADFMVPEFFVALKNIPVTARGKVDISALPIVLKEGDY